MRRWLLNARGQQSTEFVVVIATAAIAAVAMQLLARQAVSRGVRSITDKVMNDPMEAALPDFKVDETEKELDVRSTRRSKEQGRADFSRITKVTDDVTGKSRNEDVRTRTLE